jgi:VWFA-related protein
MALFVAFASMSGRAQSRDAEEDVTPLLRVDNAFVWVPVLVKTKNGRTLRSPDISRFRLLDNGSSEKVTVINTDGLPISLVILMQTGGSASRFLSSYYDLPELIGDSVHEITLVTFDSHVEEIWHFPTRTDGVDYALTHQHSGDKGAAIKDAVAFGVRQLQAEPGRFRRVVLLLSQGRDLGSSTSSQSLLEQLGTSSTVVYSLRFPAEETHARRVREARHTGEEEASKKTNRALDDQTAEEVASLTGGTDYQFDDQREFNSAMLETLSDFRYGITLGFQPSRLEGGFHRIEVGIDSPRLRVTARRAYWLTRPE